MLSARLSGLEASNAEIRTALKLDPPALRPGSEWLTMKQAAHRLRMTTQGINHLVRAGRLDSAKQGRARLISVSSLSNFHTTKVTNRR